MTPDQQIEELLRQLPKQAKHRVVDFLRGLASKPATEPTKRRRGGNRRSLVDRSVGMIPADGAMVSTPEVNISPELSEAIQASRGILQLQHNWDSEGSPDYSEATWNRATTFLSTNALRHWRDHQRWLTTPRILPGPDGNIDLHWKTPQRELLISIPADPAEPAAYYGDDREDGTDNAIRGKSLDTSQYNEWVFAWLMR